MLLRTGLAGSPSPALKSMPLLVLLGEVLLGAAHTAHFSEGRQHIEEVTHGIGALVRRDTGAADDEWHAYGIELVHIESRPRMPDIQVGWRTYLVSLGCRTRPCVIYRSSPKEVLKSMPPVWCLPGRKTLDLTH